MRAINSLHRNDGLLYQIPKKAKQPSRDILNAILLLIIVVLLFDFFAKLAFGTGLSSNHGVLVQLSPAQVYFSRVTVGAVFLLSLIIWITGRASKSATQVQLLLWSPIILLLWLNIRPLSGTASEIFRTANFTLVILSCILLAATPGISRLLFRQIYWCLFASNALGLLLFLMGSSFSYFTDGYGYMFTGIFPHKDPASLAAVLGLLLGVYYRSQNKQWLVILVIAVHVISLMCASTLSSVLAAFAGVLALYLPRLSLILMATTSAMMPILQAVYVPIALAFGKDPTFTGRTILWDFTILKGLDAPIFGHGFSHLSQQDEWTSLLKNSFKNDTFFISHAHNLWVETFYKFGVFGIAIITIPLIIFPLFMIKNRKLTGLSALAFSLLCTMTAKSALTLPFLNSDVSAYVWILAICMLAVDQHQRQRA